MIFFVCEHCGNFAGLIINSGVPMMCCGDTMTELVPNTVEASTEKHIPVAALSGSNLNVKIGSVPHPMEDGHHIAFVYVESQKGGQRKNLKTGDAPELNFTFIDDKPVAVYAYCNLHGLWKTEV